jgi:HEAT repeat protein
MTTKKRLTLGLSLVAASILAAAFATPAFYLVRGWWHGEHFFHGMPTSYWRNAIRQWNRGPDEVRWWNRALEWLGVDSKPTVLSEGDDPVAIPILLCLVKDEDDAVQIAVGYALDRLEPTTRETVPLLLESLNNQNPAVHYWAATLLGRLGKKAKTAIPALTLALQDEDHDVHHAAQESLAEIQVEEARH